MAFKLIVFIAILVLVAVLGSRGYRAAVRRFEHAQDAAEQDRGAGEG